MPDLLGWPAAACGMGFLHVHICSAYQTATTFCRLLFSLEFVNSPVNLSNSQKEEDWRVLALVFVLAACCRRSLMG